MLKIKNRISITCNNNCFEADVLLKQKPVFHNCANCGGDGRQTFITIKEFISTRSKIGAVIKKFDGKYFCARTSSTSGNFSSIALNYSFLRFSANATAFSILKNTLSEKAVQ
ncbi:MAG: hypothetical protein WCO05_04275 [Candidatus Moraniibacteriota bacterium]